MVNACGVYGCHNRRRRESDRGYYRLPAVITRQGETTKDLSIERRKEWLARLNRKEMTETFLANLRVCSDHFVKGKPSVLYDTTNPDWAPSLNLGHNDFRNAASAVERFERKLARAHKVRETTASSTLVKLGTDKEECQIMETSCEPNEKEIQTEFTGDMMEAMPCEINKLISKNNSLKGVPQLCVWKNEVEQKEKRDICLDQEQPEPPQIKEEEEELCCSQEEEQLLLKQEIKCDEVSVIPFEGLSKKHICKEETDDEQLLWKQERSSSIDEEEPDLSPIKEEQEICINEEGEQFELKQETDAFMVTEHDQEKMDSKPEPNEYPLLEANTQIRNSDAVTVQLDSPSHESLHSCDTCGKCYIQSTHLKTHKRTHTGEKPVFRKIYPKPSVIFLVLPTA